MSYYHSDENGKYVYDPITGEEFYADGIKRM